MQVDVVARKMCFWCANISITRHVCVSSSLSLPYFPKPHTYIICIPCFTLVAIFPIKHPFDTWCVCPCVSMCMCVFVFGRAFISSPIMILHEIHSKSSKITTCTNGDIIMIGIFSIYYLTRILPFDKEMRYTMAMILQHSLFMKFQNTFESSESYN